MSTATSPESVLALAREFGVTITVPRAQEISREVNALVTAVSAASQVLPFDCAPEDFRNTLVELAKEQQKVPEA